jgi:phosphoribosylaminoimidazole-succinocarboxamide synthase
MQQDSLYQSHIPGLTLIQRGKVRDIYAVDAQHMLIITSDRISAFDVILPTPIPGKGALLTTVSNHWFKLTEGLIQNHVATDVRLADVIPDDALRAKIASRALLVRKLKPLPVEAIVRGYLVGSGWKDYQQSAQVCGIDLPAGLQLASKLEQSIYTPSTKADVGDHDENVNFAHTIKLLGEELALKIRDTSLAIYAMARDYAAQRGIIIADTKFEFGLDEAGELVLIDEVLTPDSSRFWPADAWQAGKNPPSFDKQFVRDYLETLDWDKTPPGPALPTDIIDKTAAKYLEAQQRLCEG